METYNHLFSISFTVPNSKYEDWTYTLRHEQSLVVAALLNRINQIAQDSTELTEGIKGYVTYKEEN